MRRRTIILALCALAVVPAALHAATAPGSWAQPQIVTVVRHGLLAPDVASFRPDDPLTAQDLDALVGGLTGQPVLATASTSPVTITTLDARLVRAAGLTDVSSSFQAGARAAGLAPPSRLGTEAVARLLGLRTNHPTAQDYLEPLPNSPATRAEAAYSAARMLAWTGAQQTYARTAVATFSLPVLTATQREILHTALSFVGFPYVWAGTSEKAGFDCSGLVWRVYKLQAYPDLPGLADTVMGRTTAQMAAEAAPEAADRPRRPATGRHRVLRHKRAQIEARPGRSCRDLPRKRLVRAGGKHRSGPRAAHRLVRNALRMGPQAPRRRHTPLLSRNPSIGGLRGPGKG